METVLTILENNFVTIIVVILAAVFLFVRTKAGLKIDLKNQQFEVGGKSTDLGTLLSGVVHMGEVKGRTHREKVLAQKDRVDYHKEGFISTLTDGGKFQPKPFVLTLVWKDWEKHLYRIADMNRLEDKFVSETELAPEYVVGHMTALLNMLQQYRREFPNSLPENDKIEEPLKVQFQALIRAMRDIGREKDQEAELDTKVYRELLNELSGNKEV